MNECNLKHAHAVSVFALALINPCLCNKPVDVCAALQVDGDCGTPSTLTSALVQTAASRHLQPRQEVSQCRPCSRLCISLHQHVLESAHIRLYRQPAVLYWCVEKEGEKKAPENSSSPPCGSRASICNLYSLDFFSAVSAAGSHLPIYESVYYFLAVNHLPLGSILFWI